MDNLLKFAYGGLLDPKTFIGASIWGVVFLVIALVVSALIRKFSRRIMLHLTDVTGLRFVSSLAQMMVYLIAFIIYAHVIPDLRILGSALLTGASVISIVIGLAAQNTLGNLVAGLSLVLYRPFLIGDIVRLTAPGGFTTATVEIISLGYTVLRDSEKNEVIVPNSIMASSVVIRLKSMGSPSVQNDRK